MHFGNGDQKKSGTVRHSQTNGEADIVTNRDSGI